MKDNQPENEVFVKKIIDCHLTSDDIDKGLEASGANNTYQIIMIISFLFLKVVTDSFYAPLPYFLMDPKITCIQNKSTIKTKGFETYQCTLQEVCRYNNDIFNLKKGKKINFHEQSNTKKSFINDFNLWCDFLKIGLLVGSASIGSIFANIICPILTENIGRNNTIRLTLCLDIIIKSMLFIVKDIYHIYTILLLINITNNIIFNTVWIYITEMVCKERRGLYCCIFSSLFGISGIIFTLLFNFTPSWKYLHGFSILCGSIALLISLCFFKESIRFLFIRKRNEEIIQTLE